MSEASGCAAPKPLIPPRPYSLFEDEIGVSGRWNPAASGRGRSNRGLATPSNVQRTGATTIDVRWQVWRATFRQTA